MRKQFVTDEIDYCKVRYENVKTNIFDITEKGIKNVIKANVLVSMNDNECKAKQKFTTSLHVKEEEWNTIYCNPFENIVDNRIIEMQYKILHRIIGTKSLLYKMGKAPNMSCEFCDMYIETIEHLFFHCMKVKNFWFDIIEKFNDFKHVKISITCKDILLYFKAKDVSIQNCINIICLYGKKIIFVCKIRKVIPSLNEFKSYVKEKLSIINLEKYCDYRNVLKFITDKM